MRATDKELMDAGRMYQLMERIEKKTGLMMHELVGEDRFFKLMTQPKAYTINTLTAMLDDINHFVGV